MPDTSAFVVCGQVAAGNRLIAAVLERGGACCGFGDSLPVSPTVHPMPCLVQPMSVNALNSLHRSLRVRGFCPYYIYVVREKAAQIASITQEFGPISRTAFETVTRQALLQLVKEGADFEIYPIEAVMLGGDLAAAVLCGRLGLNTDVSRPLVVNEKESVIFDSDAKYWRLEWRGDHGFYPVEDSHNVYNEAYFDKYVEYSHTEQGRILTELRTSLVDTYWSGPVLDFGIGCGQFLDAYKRNSVGYDINPKAVSWLLARNMWRDISATTAIEAVTFWDSLEHVRNWRSVVNRVRKHVFVSLPIFTSLDDIFYSKHFRIDEHFWYFTNHGLERQMYDLGFRVVHHNNEETTLGRRHSIETFVFTRN